MPDSLTVLLDGDPLAPQQARLGAALVARGHRVVVLDAPAVVEAMHRQFGAEAHDLRSLPTWTGPLRG